MDIEKTIESFEKKGYKVSFFENTSEALNYLNENIKDTTVAFGGSQTLTDLNIKTLLENNNNKVLAPDFPEEGEDFITTAFKATTTEYYLLSANAITENGEIVNIDGTGNRLSGSIFGHKKVIYIIGTNKIEENLDKAIYRARNIAAPLNCKRFNLQTPCALGEMKCYDCSSPQRICRGLLINLTKIMSSEVEIILINKELGF